jgi:hypothetical protein
MRFVEAAGGASSVIANSHQSRGNGPALPVLSATEKQRACGNGPDPFETPADVLPQQVDRAGEVIFLPASPATPLNPRPMISRGSSLTDVQTASAGDAASSLSYSGGDA